MVWFGCSATFNKEAEQLVFSNTGFHSIGNHMYQTEVIRTFINCPNVSICVLPLNKGKVDLWDTLYFLLDTCINLDTAVPKQILKTIVFINGCWSV